MSNFTKNAGRIPIASSSRPAATVFPRCASVQRTNPS